MSRRKSLLPGTGPENGGFGACSPSGKTWRSLRVTAFIALLALLVAVPALAAGLPSSTTDYTGFATSGSPGDNHWNNVSQTVTVTVEPTLETTATVHFSSNGGVDWTPPRQAAATGTAVWAFVVGTEGSNDIRFYGTDSSLATETPYPPVSRGFINIDTTAPSTAATGLAPTNSQSDAAAWSKPTSRPVSLAATDPQPSPTPSPSIAVSGVNQVKRMVNRGSIETTTAATVNFTLVKGSGGVVEGSNEVQYWALDWAGNQEALRTGYVNIDTVVPTTTASPLLAATGSTGWRNTLTPVTLTATDTASGVPVGGTKYWVNDGNESVYGMPIVLPASGSYKIRFSSTDRAGNVETPVTGYANVDVTLPTVTAAAVPAPNALGWNKSSVIVGLDASDAPSGIEKLQYRVVPSGLWMDAVARAFLVTGQGQSDYEYRAFDNAGNVSSPPGDISVKIDTEAPTTTASPALATSPTSDWHNIPQDVTIVASDTVSGVPDGGTTYRVNGGNLSVYNAPIVFSASGSYVLAYSSTDRAGNTEAPLSGYMNIDTTLPAVSATVLPVPNVLGWNNGSAIVRLSASDTFSGVAKTQYRLQPSSEWVDAPGDSFAVTAQGESQYSFRAVDNAGNVSSPLGAATVKIDTAPPTTTPSGLQPDDHSGWRNTGQTVSFVATDSVSGVPADGTTYRINTGNLSIYGSPFTVGASGSTAVAYSSVDRAGNVETVQTGYVNIETTIPTVEASVGPKPNSSGWNKTTATVSLTATDTPSGIAKTQYRLQSSVDWIDATDNAFTVSAQGVQNYYFRAIDNAGNASVTGSVAVRVDTVGPKTYGKPASGTKGKPITIKYRVNDGVSPKATSIVVKIIDSKGHVAKKETVTGSKNTGRWYSFKWTPRAKGSYMYYVYAKDLAGNNQTVRGEAKVTVR